MKVIINGAAGHMGVNLTRLVEQGVCGAEAAAYVDMSLESDTGTKRYSSLPEFDGEADVLIDFSHHAAIAGILDYCTSRSLPAVIATTGHTDDEKELIYKASGRIPVFFTANMSIGVAVLTDLCRRAAAAFPDADIEIVETHHNRKLDVPSGTALMLGNSIKDVRPEAVFNIGRPDNGKRTKEEIGFHSLRMGNIVGIHEVIISTGTETITLKHEAHDRALFADGALRAAQYLIGMPKGLYNMKDMLKG